MFIEESIKTKTNILEMNCIYLSKLIDLICKVTTQVYVFPNFC